MGDLFKSRNAAKGGDSRAIPSAGDFDELPLLSQLLCGVPSKDGKGYDAPPHSLTIWLEGSILKYVLGAGDDEPKWFGTTSGLSHGLLGIEKSLSTEQGEWKQPKNAKSSWRK